MNLLTRTLARTRRFHESGDGGFTVLEVMVALSIFAVGLLAVSMSSLVALRNIAFSRQRQAATGYVNSTIEEARGLPYATITTGMKTSDLDPAQDSNISYSAGPPATYTFRGESIPNASTATPPAPLYPHRVSVAMGGTTYTRKVYITQASGVAAGAFRLTVLVSWTNSQRAAASTIESQTMIYSSAPTATDCVSSITHPYSGPCQPFFYGTGTIGSGNVHTTGSVSGLTFDSFDVDLRRQNSDLQVEQVTQIQSSATLAGTRKTVAGTTTTAPSTEAAAIAAADGDPSSSSPKYDTRSVSQGAASVGVSGGGNALTAIAGGGDSGSATATSSASSVNQCNGQVDGRPCSYTSLGQGTLQEYLDLEDNVGRSYLVDVAAATAANTAYGRTLETVVGHDGLVRERVTRQLATVKLGGLPSSLSAPSGWSSSCYWVCVVNYTGTVQAEAGTDTAAPTQTVTGQVQWWNGSGYSTTAIAAAAQPTSVPVPSWTYSRVNASGDTITVSYSASLSIDTSPTPNSTVVSGTTTRTYADAILGSPLKGSIAMTISRNGSTRASLTLAVDLGTTKAATTYQAAPTG
jgi:prepilin-type N-terminal cleavage/methylation domain-containing protein